MHKLYKSNINIGGKDKIVTVLNYKKDESTAKKIDSIHHIHLLDRSYSMYRDIDTLIDNVKQTLSIMNKEDYVSIIWFSGNGEYRTLVKGAKFDDSLYYLLDGIKYCVGCTCFSESLKEVGQIMDDLESICPNFNVTLFTDGEPVVPWRDEEERAKLEVDKWKDKALALNTVGYGNYYNQEFLKELSDKTDFGKMVHSSDIKEYLPIWTDNFNRVENLVIDKVDIQANAEIMYISSKATKLHEKEFSLKAIDDKKNQFVFISDNDTSIILDSDTLYNTSEIVASVPKNTLNIVLYAYAYELYYNGRREEALDILSKNLKDKFLIDNQINAFTYDEVAVYSKKLKKAIFSSQGRLLSGECSDDYLPAENAPCLMDMFSVLLNGNNYYVLSKDYKRIGLQTKDTFNLFKKDDVEVVTPISDLVLNKDKLNVSIRSIVSGTVSLNPLRAKAVGLPETIKSRTFRNQTIIKDGFLNLEEITCIIDDDTKAYLNSFSENLIVAEDLDEKGTRVHLNLKALPIINKLYLAKSDEECILQNAFDIFKLEACQKVLNSLIKLLPQESKVIDGVEYTPEQLEVLKEHGLDKNLNYSGVKREKEAKGEDFYVAKSFVFQLKGLATVPSLNAVIKKIDDDKKLNKADEIIKKYIEYLSSLSNTDIAKLDVEFDGARELFEKELKTIKTELLEKRIEMFSVKLAKVITGGWFNKAVPDRKGNYLYEKEDLTLVIKAEKEEVYF